MNLPIVITNLVKAQDRFDAKAYANCFSKTGVVYDEGKTHSGRTAIEQWFIEASMKYNLIMKPLHFEDNGATGILKSEVSGSFPGSPAVFTYNLVFKGELIQSLKITL
jgi:hypothetical protein